MQCSILDSGYQGIRIFPPLLTCVVQRGPTEGIGRGGGRELQNGKSNQLKSERRSETPGTERKKDEAESGRRPILPLYKCVVSCPPVFQQRTGVDIGRRDDDAAHSTHSTHTGRVLEMISFSSAKI